MTTQHTPGPWKLSLGSEYVIDGGNGQNVFLIGNDRRAIPSPDDARLILAAPDLLACLSELQLAVTMRPMGQTGLSARERSALDKAREAIAKATQKE